MSASQPTTGTTPPTGSIQVGTGQDFELGVGEAAIVTGTPVTVIFRSVSQDSRCPSDVTCVWAGDGAVRFELQSTAAPSQETILHTTLEPKVVNYSGYRIELKRLDPYPKKALTPPPAKYVVTMQVFRP
jgi:hypothetical protein